MSDKNTRRDMLMMIGSMCIFGTIGILRKHLDMPSAFLALCRALVGTVFLLGIVALRRSPMDLHRIRGKLPRLILSGAFLGFNWILLFEAYRFTTVTCATLCYYMEPSIVVVASHFLFRERLNLKKGICVLVALAGMVLVCGVTRTGITGFGEFRGILSGLGAAVLYACVVLLNKKLTIPSAFDRTIFQLAVAAVILLPYTLLTEDLSQVVFSPLGIALLTAAGVVHTGIAYAMYFGSVPKLPGHTVAILSYIDPIVAILLSAIVLKEPMGISEISGTVLILGAAYISEK